MGDFFFFFFLKKNGVGLGKFFKMVCGRRAEQRHVGVG